MYKSNKLVYLMYVALIAIGLVSSAFACQGDNDCGSEEFCSDSGSCEYSKGLPLKLFYPFGQDHGDAKLDALDDGKDELPLQIPINYMQVPLDVAYIGVNGLISFGSSKSEIEDIPFDSPSPAVFPVINQKFIAPFWIDLDASGKLDDGNDIYFRETRDDATVQRASKIAREAFASDEGMTNWNAKSVIIVTWYRVGTYPARVDKLNTFQVAIATDGTRSFAQFFYGQMSSSFANNRYARLGLNFAPEGQTNAQAIEIGGSGSESSKDAAMKSSNCGIQGLHVYSTDSFRGASSTVQPLDSVIAVSPSQNTPLIVGLVVGLVGTALIGGAVVFAIIMVRRRRAREVSSKVEMAAKKADPEMDTEAANQVGPAGMGTTPRDFTADVSAGAGPAMVNRPLPPLPPVPPFGVRIINPIRAPTTPVVPHRNHLNQ
jgi:hypothetical protein